MEPRWSTCRGLAPSYYTLSPFTFETQSFISPLLLLTFAKCELKFGRDMCQERSAIALLFLSQWLHLPSGLPGNSLGCSSRWGLRVCDWFDHSDVNTTPQERLHWDWPLDLWSDLILLVSVSVEQGRVSGGGWRSPPQSQRHRVPAITAFRLGGSLCSGELLTPCHSEVESL